VRPQPGGGITWARSTYDSRIGPWKVRWALEGGRLTVDVEVPCGGEASVNLPGKDLMKVPSGAWSFSCVQDK